VPRRLHLHRRSNRLALRAQFADTLDYVHAFRRALSAFDPEAARDRGGFATCVAVLLS